MKTEMTLRPAAVLPAPPNAFSPIWRNETILCWFLIVIAFSLLAGAYRAGLAAGLHTYIGTHSGGQFLGGVCAVATKWLVGVGNYVCLGEVSTIMANLGLAPAGPTWPGFLADRVFLDEALRSLFYRPHWVVPVTTSGPPYNGITGIGWGMDNGYADFVNLAFHIFGPAIKSLYRGYWLVCGISYVLFAIAYRRTVVPLVLLVAAAVSQYIFFSSNILWSNDFAWLASQNAHVHGPTTPRFLSSICVIPALHLLCATWDPGRLRWREAMLLGLQGIVLCLAIQQRTTVYWVVAAAVLLAALQYVFLLRPTPVEQKSRHHLILAGLLGLLVLNTAYLKIVTHPGLAARGYTATHTLWGSLFYSLQAHPDWRTRYSAEFENEVGDGVASVAWHRYLVRHPSQARKFMDSDGNITQALIEQMTKKAFIEFAKHDPIFVLDMYVFYNPHMIFIQGAALVGVVAKGIPVVFLLFLIALGFVISIVSSRATLRLLMVSVPLVAILCISSSLPSWATLVMATSMTDFLVLLLIVGVLLTIILGVSGGLILRRILSDTSKIRAGEF